MPRISKAPEARKQELVDVAMELFWRQGYENTTVSDIVRQVGVAQGLFYYYFASKEEIFLSAVDSFVQVRVEEFAQIIRDEAQPPIERMRSVVIALSDFLRQVDSSGLRGRLGLSLEANVRVHQHVMEGLEPIFARMLAEGAAQGLLDVPYPAHMARFILAGFVGVEGRKDAPEADEMIELVLELVERTLRLPAGTLKQ